MAKLITVNVSKLNAADCQPGIRTLPRALAGLRVDIERQGVLSPIHVVNGGDDYVIIDGHRRWTIARDLKIQTLPALLHDVRREEVAALWATLNRNTRTVNAYEWLCWWRRVEGTGVELSMPKNILANIQSCIRIFGGKRQLQYLEDTNTAPTICKIIEGVYARFRDKPSLGEIPTPGQIGMWMIRHRTQSICQLMIKQAPTPIGWLRKALTRIRADSAMTVADLASRRVA